MGKELLLFVAMVAFVAALVFTTHEEMKNRQDLKKACIEHNLPLDTCQ